ncbi:hypothetical protein [Aquimarina sp. 2201CG14-23]|nr:hypothetical protein [Aquimarina sp. 2201CG14-23]MDH7446086.1 hypothetical protein [Aquimarina sp. 2201CG14-23]
MKNSHNKRKLKLEKLKVAKLNNLYIINGGRTPPGKSERFTCPTQEEQ